MKARWRTVVLLVVVATVGAGWWSFSVSPPVASAAAGAAPAAPLAAVKADVAAPVVAANPDAGTEADPNDPLVPQVRAILEDAAQ